MVARVFYCRSLRLAVAMQGFDPDHRIFLLPGLLCDQTVWEAQVPVLEKIGHVTIPEFRGYKSITDMADLVLGMAGSEGSFSLVGHSMGARVAFEVIRMAPQRVRKVVLMSTAMHVRKHREAELRHDMLSLARERGMRAFAERWMDRILETESRCNAALVKKITAMVLASNVEDLESHIIAMLYRPDPATYLRAIDREMLLICGRQDSWTTPAHHRQIARKLPRCRLRVLTKGGHMLPMESPGQVNRLLTSYLRN